MGFLGEGRDFYRKMVTTVLSHLKKSLFTFVIPKARSFNMELLYLHWPTSELFIT